MPEKRQNNSCNKKERKKLRARRQLTAKIFSAHSQESFSVLFVYGFFVEIHKVKQKQKQK